MAASSNTTHWRSWFLLLLTTVAFGCSVSGWAGDSSISRGFWPSDIHQLVVKMLGGSVSRNAVNELVYEVNSLTATLRLGLVVCLLALASKFVWNRSEHSAIPQTALLFAVSCSWWLIWMLGEIGFVAAASFAIAVAPLWVTATAGIFCWIWMTAFVSVESSNLPHQQTRKPAVLLAVGVLGWVAVSFWMNFCLYEQLLIPHGDSAMYEEHLWNVWHGKGFRSYLDQGLFLGEHVQVIHLLLLPLHMIWPSHLLLELTESVALASCTIPIYRMVARKTGDRWAGAFLGLAWLLYFPMHFLDIAIDQKTFRPIALGLPFLFWMVDFTEVKRYRAALVCLILALSAKEDIALITFPLLTVLALRVPTRHEARWPAAMALGSIVYLIAVVVVVIPWFRSGEVVHYSRYFGDLGNSPGELFKTALRDPGRVVAQVLTVQTLLYAIVFLLPLAFLPTRRLLCLSAGVFTFAMLSLLQFGDASGLPPVPYHHFHAPLLVVVFWALICGLESTDKAVTNPPPRSFFERLGLSNRNSRSAAVLVLCLCAATGLTGSLMPFGVTFWSKESGFGWQNLYLPASPRQQERSAMVSEVLRQIPESARVAATDFIHTRLTHRERSYDYSKYLRKVNDYQPGVPADTDYIVIDTRHRYSEYHTAVDVPELQQDDWELLPDTTNGTFLILRRR